MSGVVTYHRPTDLAEALALLASAPRRILAGGTDLYTATGRSSLSGAVLDVTAIPALQGYREEAEAWRLGAAMTWSEVLDAKLPPAFQGLKLAAREVGARQIQNRGTLAGNLCNASPAADGVPPLLTLDAAVEIASSKATRRVPLADFITGVRRTVLREDELVTALLVPKSAAGGRASFLKLGARRYLVISIAMVAARIGLEEGRVAELALAVGSCSAVARRLPTLEAALVGLPAGELAERVQDEAVARLLDPIDDLRGTAAYRNHAAAELIRRSLGAALQGASERIAA